MPSVLLIGNTDNSLFIILVIAYRITYRIIGPFDRIVRELDEVAKDKKQDHIVLRKKDKFKPLVDGINKLIDKCRR